MELNKTYTPAETEEKWYAAWMEHRLFHSVPDGLPAYTITMAPPNVTGILHMGHVLNNTVQDILIRRARMQGYNACWVPGTDHASIATEAKVVAHLKEQGIEKNQLGREEFLKHAWEWKEKYGGIILQQLRKLGCSCDWDRTVFTMDPDYYAAVMRVFVELYKKGHIYRGVKMIHWDPKALTALSDEEVNYKEVKSNLYYVRYKVEGSGEEWITVATTRPETILGDTAVCVHPEDERYRSLYGKYCFVPLLNRRVPIITDDYIDREFGTGALKVTPAHDLNDYNLGLKHKLEVIDTLNPDGTMSAAAGLYVGEDRFVVRKKIAKQLEAEGHLVKVEEILNKNGFSERTNVVIEPRLSLQWWCRMGEMAPAALKAVAEGDINFYPPKFKNTYSHWMNNIRDWCISRQLWWGHRIPAWYLPGSQEPLVGNSREEVFGQIKALHPGLKAEDLQQDNDVLDTWFSSWLWPFEVLGWNKDPGNKDLASYYPTDTLVTAPEIIFFWVARMIMAGMEFTRKIPFRQVYFTGIVRDKQGRKMSKSLGNSPDLLDLIDKNGADALRFGILFASPAGNDLLYDEKLVEQGRNFNNKIWNALRLIRGWDIREGSEESNAFAIQWFGSRLSQAAGELESLYAEFNVSGVLKTLYNLIWDDFCAWYLEMIKPDFEQPIDRATYEATVGFMETLMQWLHPVMPFVTEEIYHHLRERVPGEFLQALPLKPAAPVEQGYLEKGAWLQQVMMQVRDLRNKNQVKPREPLPLHVRSGDMEWIKPLSGLLCKLGNLSGVHAASGEVEGAVSFVIRNDTFFLGIPRAIDAAADEMRLREELAYQEGFLESVMKKLGNGKFVANAKADVIEKERMKASDAENKIRVIREQLEKRNAN